MRLLLDTQIVLWQIHGRRTLSPAGASALEAAAEIALSVVSFVEVGIKLSVGKLRISREVREYVHEFGLHILGLAPEHGLGVADLPLHHRDPFDRLLIAQAQHERLTILTADKRFARYDVPVVLA